MRAPASVAVAALLGGCGAFERLDASRSRAVEDQPFRTELGEGWALRVPSSARVDAQGDELRVDTADGRWWVDVQQVRLQGPTEPIVTADQWAESRCRPVRWDVPATPVAGTWTAGGLCTIEHRDYWVVLALEDVGEDRRLLTAVVADRYRVPHEDLWVAFVDVALSLTAGEAPARLLEPGDLRALLREVTSARVAQAGLEAQVPRPGGGTFSRDASLALRDVWARRAAADLPARLLPRP